MNSKNGCVYFLKHKGLTPIKIGFSTHKTPLSRINQFNTYAPFGIDLVGYIETENAFKLESILHKKYRKYRLNGEWFEISREQALKDISFYSSSKEYKLNYFDKYSLKEIFDSLERNVLINNDVFYSKFNNDITQKRIHIELKKYCKYSGLLFKKYNTNGNRKIQLITL